MYVKTRQHNDCQLQRADMFTHAITVKYYNKTDRNKLVNANPSETQLKHRRVISFLQQCSCLHKSTAFVCLWYFIYPVLSLSVQGNFPIRIF